MDKAGIRAVLEQSPHQVGQKILMRAHWGVGAQAERPEMPLPRLIQGASHAVQTLVFDCNICCYCHGPHRRQRMGVVSGELAAKSRSCRDQSPGTNKVGKVGGGLGSEDRISAAARNLGSLDLGV